MDMLSIAKTLNIPLLLALLATAWIQSKTYGKNQLLRL